MENRGAELAKSSVKVIAACVVIYAIGAGLLLLATRSNSILQPDLLQQLLNNPDSVTAVSANLSNAAAVMQNWWFEISGIMFAAAFLWNAYASFKRPGTPDAEFIATASWYGAFTCSALAILALAYRKFWMLSLAAALNPKFLAIALVGTGLGAVVTFIFSTAIAVKPQLRSSVLFANLLSRPRS